MARRDEEKKRRRQKRLEKRQPREQPSRPLLASLDESEGSAIDLERALKALERHMNVAQPTHWPGGCHPSLARPDLVKLELANSTVERPPGREKAKKFLEDVSKGLLYFLPERNHWAIEEVLWHGAPGDAWRPIDAYLEEAGDRYPPEAARQLRLWREARIGAFEIGEVADATVGLQEWDLLRRTTTGEPFRAITLNIGGVNIYRDLGGRILLTYVAPWLPEENLFCGLGYGSSFPKREATSLMLPFLNLRHPEVAARPLPWKVGSATAAEYLREWHRREWQGWLSARLRFPFQVLVMWPNELPELAEARSLLPATPAEARSRGNYLEVRRGHDPLLIGASMVWPVDITSAERLALAEYRAYRDHTGPPPGVRGRPPTFTLP